MVRFVRNLFILAEAKNFVYDSNKPVCHHRKKHYKLTILKTMGFNVTGVATSIKTENINELTKLLGIGPLTMLNISNFESATSSSIGENEIFLTKTSNGTILTVGDEIDIDNLSFDKISAYGKALKFMVGETAMVFGFDYYENGKLVRSVINVQDKNIQEEGESLEIEKTEDDFTEIIFNIMETVSGDSIYTLEPDIQSIRFLWCELNAHS